MNIEESSGIDRREGTRVPFMVVEIQGEHSNKIFLAQSENVSKGGLFFSSPESMKIGDRVPIEFILPDNKTVFRCMSEVMWKKTVDKSGFASEGVGIRFVDLDEEKKQIISDWIDHEEEKELGH